MRFQRFSPIFINKVNRIQYYKKTSLEIVYFIDPLSKREDILGP